MSEIQCPECRVRFTPRRSDQAYCSSACNKSASDRELKRGRRIYRAVYHWRLQRKAFGPAMAWLCREVASWIREDREAQRLPPPPHDHMSDRGHERPAQPVKL